MIFGNPEVFAIEAILEPGPDYECVCSNNIAGRIRVWMCGHSVGRFDEPACWLGPPCHDLAKMARSLDQLWHGSLDDLSPDEIFDRLDYLYFGAHRGRCLTDDEDWDDEAWNRAASESGDFGRFVFLIHFSEAFDGWKAFLVFPPDADLMALVFRHGSPDVLSFQFSAESFREAVHDFGCWVEQEERRLLTQSD